MGKGVQFGAVAMAALALAPGALGGGGVTGTYGATIKSPAQLKGKWVVALAKGGTYTVALNGERLARGTYSTTATTITFREPSQSGCGGTGTYAWKKSGKTLRFVRKREVDRCQARAAVLAHPFTQLR
jgi:hypothetical protein